MNDSYLSAVDIASRLIKAHDEHTRRIKYKCLALTLQQFNAAAGRQKVEDTVYVAVARILGKSGLHLLRYGPRYLLVSSESYDAFPTPKKADIGLWKKTSQRRKEAARTTRAPAPPARTALTPAEAWPFPTGNKPKSVRKSAA